jgi:hypothetical protein
MTMVTSTSTAQEQILWSNISESGLLFHRHVGQRLEVTNYAVIMEKEGQPIVRIPFSLPDNVQVLNAHSVGTSTHQTIGVGYYSRIYIGQAQHQSSTLGIFYLCKVQTVC